MAEVDPPRSLLPAMNEQSVDSFLGAPRQSAHLATARKDGTPQVGPVWFYWDRPTMWIVTFHSAARSKNIQRQSRVGASIDANRFPAIGCALYGNAELVDPRADVIERIVERYIPRARVQSFVDRYMADPDRVLIRINVDRVIAWNA